jgi:hypothetical protein
MDGDAAETNNRSAPAPIARRINRAKHAISSS